MKTLAMLAAAPLLLILVASQLDAGSGEGERKAEKSDTEKVIEHLAKADGGVWVTAAGFRDPKADHACFTTSVGFHDRVRHDRTWLVKGGKDLPLYEGTYYVNPRSKQVEYIQVAAGGDVYKGTVTLDGETEVFLFTDYSAQGESEWKQVSKYIDADTMESKVYKKDAGEWKEAHTFLFHRVKKDEQAK